MKTINEVFFFFILLGFIFNSPVFAADNNDTAALVMDIPSICKLTVRNADQSINLLQDASGEAAYEAGYVNGATDRPELTIDSNTSWKLSVRVRSDWNNVNGYQKQISDLMLKATSRNGRQTGFIDFASLAMNDQEIASNSQGIGSSVYNCQYRVLLGWEKDKPGAYNVIIVYTLATQ
ncbi:MAG: hypothetical protein Q8N76_05490 [Candidatus Omnitrophota bacterium]|nr:hypothetical protein [Candidatus Omnitrophota bacterium]